MKKILTTISLLTALLTLTAGPAQAREGAGGAQDLKRYIIELQDPPLALYGGDDLSVPSRAGERALDPTAIHLTGERKLNLRSPRAQSYLRFLDERHEAFQLEAAVLAGRAIQPVFRYRAAVNGMAVDLSEAEVARLEQSPMVRSISLDEVLHLETFAGPEWIGAGVIWNGESGFPASEGEEIIVGIIDGGINWESPSFADPSPDGYNHANPLGQQVGLCELDEVECNDKLIGVWDYVTDIPDTEEVEENTNGRDIAGHGSHVASIAAGNPVSHSLQDGLEVTLSGVAPRANIITYRVCHTNRCNTSATIAALEQAMQDGVDVLNYSVGGEARNPWQLGGESRAFLSARSAGIVAVTSAGNSGPDPETISSPAIAPWMVAVGWATHDAGAGSLLQNLTGGGSTPPGDMVGASLTDGTGQLQIVHARDYGYPLCGTGEAESRPSCVTNIGLSNPWAGETPFNGEIVVCDRGTYGRVEKGKNLLLAGAGGYVLANDEAWGESIVADDHCLPAVHIGASDGDRLRAWLASGIGHGASISGYELFQGDLFGDRIDFDSSRGPALPPVEDVLKPNLIAPGTAIIAATESGAVYEAKSGTSMSSPHVAGAAALVKSVHPDWSVSQIVSSIELTATGEQAKNFDGRVPTPHDMGAGRPQLGEAVNAGLYLNQPDSGFITANPGTGGEPKDLNLAGLIDAFCKNTCSLTRTVTDQMGGGNWTAVAEGFPQGVTVSISPSSFSLGSGSSQALDFRFELPASVDVGDWVYGRIRLSAAGSPDLVLTASLRSYGGDLPSQWALWDDRNGGWQNMELSGLTALPDLTLTVGGLVQQDTTVQTLVEDPTRDDPYDGGEGVMTVWYSLPRGGLWITTETLGSTAEDLDLFVGRDANGNGRADESEELCSSTTPIDLERCELFDVEPGDYWVLVQNWAGTEEGGDEATLLSAAIGPGDDYSMAASGPGITAAEEPFTVRLSWDNLNALSGETWLGAVGVGSTRDAPNNIGIIPVQFRRTGYAQPETFPLMNDVTHSLALDAGATHDRMFIDVPSGASSLTVFTGAVDNNQNENLTLTLKLLDFEDGLSDPPFATPAGSAPTEVSAEGTSQEGPSITVFGVAPGRWYAELTNGNDTAVAAEVLARVEFEGTPLPIHRGLWEPSSRPGLGQGYDYNWGGNSRALIWYTYDEDGQPVWYIAGSPAVQGNIWVADLLRVTNDGAQQQLAPVGSISVTSLAEDDALFSFTLYGQSGTERMKPISLQTCPQVDGAPRSYTGIWYRGADGLGGASVLVNAQTQAQIHYLFDALGMPRWLFAQDPENMSPTDPEIPFLQFRGYCAVCDPAEVSFLPDPVGVLAREFSSETSGSWTLDYMFEPPLSGSAERMDQIVKLTDTLDCR